MNVGQKIWILDLCTQWQCCILEYAIEINYRKISDHAMETSCVSRNICDTHNCSASTCTLSLAVIQFITMWEFHSSAFWRVCKKLANHIVRNLSTQKSTYEKGWQILHIVIGPMHCKLLKVYLCESPYSLEVHKIYFLVLK